MRVVKFMVNLFVLLFNMSVFVERFLSNFLGFGMCVQGNKYVEFIILSRLENEFMLFEGRFIK